MDRMEQFESVCSESEEKDPKDYSRECAIEWLRGDKVVTVTFRQERQSATELRITRRNIRMM